MMSCMLHYWSNFKRNYWSRFFSYLWRDSSPSFPQGDQGESGDTGSDGRSGDKVSSSFLLRLPLLHSRLLNYQLSKINLYTGRPRRKRRCGRVRDTRLTGMLITVCLGPVTSYNLVSMGLSRVLVAGSALMRMSWGREGNRDRLTSLA